MFMCVVWRRRWRSMFSVEKQRAYTKLGPTMMMMRHIYDYILHPNKPYLCALSCNAYFLLLLSYFGKGKPYPNAVSTIHARTTNAKLCANLAKTETFLCFFMSSANYNNKFRFLSSRSSKPSKVDVWTFCLFYVGRIGKCWALATLIWYIRKQTERSNICRMYWNNRLSWKE